MGRSPPTLSEPWFPRLHGENRPAPRTGALTLLGGVQVVEAVAAVPVGPCRGGGGHGRGRGRGRWGRGRAILERTKGRAPGIREGLGVAAPSYGDTFLNPKHLLHPDSTYPCSQDPGSGPQRLFPPDPGSPECGPGFGCGSPQALGGVSGYYRAHILPVPAGPEPSTTCACHPGPVGGKRGRFRACVCS